MKVPPLAIPLSLFIASVNACDKSIPDDPNDPGACEAGVDSFLYEVTLAAAPIEFIDFLTTGSPYLGGDRIYYLEPAAGRIQFFSAVTKGNICAKEHLNVHYKVITLGQGQPVPLKIFGEAFWGVYSDEIPLVDGPVDPNEPYDGNLEVGLNQAFGDNEATVHFYVNVEFDTQGSFAADSAYFMQHIERLVVDFGYDKHHE